MPSTLHLHTPDRFLPSSKPDEVVGIGSSNALQQVALRAEHSEEKRLDEDALPPASWLDLQQVYERIQELSPETGETSTAAGKSYDQPSALRSAFEDASEEPEAIGEWGFLIFVRLNNIVVLIADLLSRLISAPSVFGNDPPAITRTRSGTISTRPERPLILPFPTPPTSIAVSQPASVVQSQLLPSPIPILLQSSQAYPTFALYPAVEASADRVGGEAARSTTIEDNEEDDGVMEAVELESFQERHKEGLGDERDADLLREDLGKRYSQPCFSSPYFALSSRFFVVLTDLPASSDLPKTEPIRTIESTSSSPDICAPPAETAFSDETTSAFDSSPPALPRRVTFQESIESDSSSGSGSDSNDSELDEDAELEDVRRMMFEEEGSVFEDEERTEMDQLSVQHVEVETESLDSVERDGIVDLDNGWS
jgi:hypothetical protein